WFTVLSQEIRRSGGILVVVEIRRAKAAWHRRSRFSNRKSISCSPDLLFKTSVHFPFHGAAPSCRCPDGTASPRTRSETRRGRRDRSRTRSPRRFQRP